nr:MAG TPA: hypothetical protein [Caudoviricetes sp.]DAX75096.1 MAG TPA: hypothetical protein [Caudoviricetes sp.]
MKSIHTTWRLLRVVLHNTQQNKTESYLRLSNLV